MRRIEFVSAGCERTSRHPGIQSDRCFDSLDRIRSVWIVICIIVPAFCLIPSLFWSVLLGACLAFGGFPSFTLSPFLPSPSFFRSSLCSASFTLHLCGSIRFRLGDQTRPCSLASFIERLSLRTLIYSYPLRLASFSTTYLLHFYPFTLCSPDRISIND